MPSWRKLEIGRREDAAHYRSTGKAGGDGQRSCRSVTVIAIGSSARAHCTALLRFSHVRARLAGLDYAVKLMMAGGVAGWLDESFALASGAEEAAA